MIKSKKNIFKWFETSYNDNYILPDSKFLDFIISLYPPWRRKKFIQKCLNELNSRDGPVVYKSGGIQKFDPSMTQEIRREIPCKISITDGKQLKRGLGCYYGCGYVLTAFHVFKGLENCDIFVTFPNGKHTLIYKAKFPVSCNTDRDLAYIALRGDCIPLGDGLQNQAGEANENESIYFYTQTPGGNVQKQKGKITVETYNNFLLSVAGEEGDSGSPVYKATGELIGIYGGLYEENGPGVCRIINPHFRLANM